MLALIIWLRMWLLHACRHFNVLNKEFLNISVLSWKSICSRMTQPSLPHYEIRYSGNGLKQSVFSGQIHQQVNFHSPRRAMIGRERTNSDGGVQVAVPVTNPSQGANILSIYALDLIETMFTSWTDLQIVSAIYYFPQDILSLYLNIII